MSAKQPIGHVNMTSEYTKPKDPHSSGREKRESTGHYYLSSEPTRPKSVEKKHVEGHKDMGVHPNRHIQDHGRDTVGHKDISSHMNRERQTDKLPVAGHKLIGSRGSATKERERRSGSIGHHSMNSRSSRQMSKTVPPKAPTGHRSMHVEHPEIVSSTLSPKDHRVTYPSDYNYLAKNSRGDGNLNLNKYPGEVEQRHPSHLQPYHSRRHTEAILKPTNRIVPEETKLADELQRRQIQQHEKINQRPDSTRKKSKHVHFNNPN